MPTDSVYILGAGGHAKVVIDALKKERGGEIDIRLFDDNREHSTIAGLVVRKAAPILPGEKFHVAIGNNEDRGKRFNEISNSGAIPLTITHPMSAVAESAQIAAGVFVAAFSTMGPNSVAGKGSIVNHGAVVDHDCRLGDFCHIAPGSVLGGGVTIGDRVLVGAGAVILAGVTVGSDIVIGAGAVLTRSIRQAGTYIGVPAREIRKEENDRAR